MEPARYPDWALKYKTKGTELRNIKGSFALYRVSSVWNKSKKRSQKVTEEYIGIITEKEGLIPKGSPRAKDPKLDIPTKNVCVKEYGATTFLNNVGSQILEKLKSDFSEHWRELWALASYRLLYRAPLKNMEYFLSESYFSEIHNDLDLSKNRLTLLMRDLGSDREKMLHFMRHFIGENAHIIFDTTHLITKSKNLTMNHVGYNSENEFDPQINLFYMFAVDIKMPVFYRLFPGNIHGIKALKICLKESGVKKALVIGDKGFCSQENFEALQESGLHFIVPLKRNNALINYERLNARNYKTAFDGHFFYQDRLICFYTIMCDKKQKIVVFYDQRLRTDEETSYLRHAHDKREGFSMDTYLKKQNTFGTISIFTNTSDRSPEAIYLKYKSRMEVEVVFDSYKNLLEADRIYMQSDDALNAWVFINHIAIMLYYSIFNLIKEKKLSSNLSPNDLISRLTRINQIKIDGDWHLAEINFRTSQILGKLEKPIT